MVLSIRYIIFNDDTSAKIDFSLTTAQYHKCNYDHLMLSKSQLSEIKDLYIKLTNIFEYQGISFFAIGGTLIGAVRNGGLIPWDDDIDLGVLEKDVGFIESYKDSEYYFQTQGFGYKFRKNNYETFIDIMVFINNNGKLSIKDNVFPREYFYDSELLPLKKHTFSELYIYVPNNFINYLDRAFNGWDKKIIYNCYKRHHNSVNTEKCLDVIRKEDVLCYSDL